MERKHFDQLVKLGYIKFWDFTLKNWQKTNYLTWYNWVKDEKKVNDILWEIFLQKYKKILGQKIHFIGLANSGKPIAEKIFSISQKFNNISILSITNPKFFDTKNIKTNCSSYKHFLIDNSVISWKTLKDMESYLYPLKIDWCFHIFSRNCWDEPSFDFPLYEIFCFDDIKDFL